MVYQKVSQNQRLCNFPGLEVYSNVRVVFHSMSFLFNSPSLEVSLQRQRGYEFFINLGYSTIVDSWWDRWSMLVLVEFTHFKTNVRDLPIAYPYTVHNSLQ